MAPMEHSGTLSCVSDRVSGVVSFETIPEFRTLSQKRARFVQEYCTSWNTSQAARAAGFAAKRADRQGRKMIADPKVAGAIEAIRRALDAAIECTRADIMRELQTIAFAKLTDFGVWLDDGTFLLKPSTDIPPELMGAVCEVIRTEEHDRRTGDLTSVKIRLKLHPKLEALRMLGQIKIPELRTNTQVQAQVNVNAPGGKVAVQIGETFALYDQAISEVVKATTESRALEAGEVVEGEVIEVPEVPV